MPNTKSEMVQRKPPVEFTEARKLQFVEYYRQYGLVHKAAELVGVSDWTVSDHRKRDPEFNVLCDEAKQRWIDEVLVSEAVRRGTEGVDEPIIGGQFRNEVVGTKTIYSDGLLLALLRANRSEFRDGSSAAGQGAGSSPVMFIPSSTPATLDDWEEKYGEAAKGQTGQGQTP